MPKASILEGDCRDVLATLPASSVQTCVTSPPYFGLRDYEHDGQIGLEVTPDEYVASLVAVFRGVWRVLREDGTLWLNLGDTYLDKRLLGIPWRVAMALQEDGWLLRSDIIWHKPNPMPLSVTDRPSLSHEYIFLLAKSGRYFYDAEAIKEKASGRARGNRRPEKGLDQKGYEIRSGLAKVADKEWHERNKRTVWTVATRPFADAHFATYPPELIEPCVLAGSRPSDTVLDPFNGAGTTGLVASRHGRDYIGIELNPRYAAMARQRIGGDNPLFNQVG